MESLDLELLPQPYLADTRLHSPGFTLHPISNQPGVAPSAADMYATPTWLRSLLQLSEHYPWTGDVRENRRRDMRGGELLGVLSIGEQVQQLWQSIWNLVAVFVLLGWADWLHIIRIRSIAGPGQHLYARSALVHLHHPSMPALFACTAITSIWSQTRLCSNIGSMPFGNTLMFCPCWMLKELCGSAVLLKVLALAPICMLL